jgi:5,10-methylenetetrahydromethanopterin reductase
MPAVDTVKWGVGCWQTHVLDDLRADLEAVEQSGFDYFWYGNEKLHADMWVGLAAAALHSRRVKLGTFIADPYSVHPAMTASMIATLDHYSDGRAVLLLGAGGSGLHELGLERTKPLRTMEDTVTTIRDLLAGRRVVRDGPVFAADAQLHFPARADLPIWLATRGERMLELAGRVADGVMVGTIARAEDLADAIAHVQVGAEAAGRRLDDLTLCARVDVVVDQDRSAARDALRAFVAGVLSASYPDRGFVERAGLQVPDDLEEICARKDLRLAWSSGHLVPDAFVDAFTWAGTPDDVAERVAAALELGVENVTVVFHRGAGPTPAQIRGFATTVIPRVYALRGVPKGG